MEVALVVSVMLVLALGFLCVYQYLARRAALRVAEMIYVMSRNVAEKAAEVRTQQKHVEIVEAQIHNIVTTARTLLQSLGFPEARLDADPEHAIIPRSPELSGDSLIRLADRILFSVREEAPKADPKEIVIRTLDRFTARVPTVDREKARRIIMAVARQGDQEDGQMVGMASG